MSPPGWEHFEHDADIGVRGLGASKPEAFEQAAIALMAVITDPGRIAAREAVRIHCEAPDDELLLVDWLNRLIFEMATRGFLFGRFEVRLADGRLEATAWGEPTNVQRHRPAVEIKGATYTELRVAEERGRWIAQTVVDV
jgi:tRNA nucleotidyltransferase (CCA-adding enzyme)